MSFCTYCTLCMCIVCMLGNYSIISKNPRKIRLNFWHFGKRKNNQHQKGKGGGGGGRRRGGVQVIVAWSWNLSRNKLNLEISFFNWGYKSLRKNWTTQKAKGQPIISVVHMWVTVGWGVSSLAVIMLKTFLKEICNTWNVVMSIFCEFWFSLWK